MRRIYITLFLLFAVAFYSIAQQLPTPICNGPISGEEIVNETEISCNNGKSYLVIKSLKLTPGFSVSASEHGEFYIKMLDQPTNVPPNPEQNYVRTEIIQESGITTENQIAPLSPNGKVTSFNYIDGIGRTIQTVAQEAGASGKDIVQPYSYDNKSRTDKAYIVQEHSGKDGAFRPSAVTDLLNTYTNEVPYTSYSYESSPLDRLLSTTGPGAVWHSNNKNISGKTKLNTASEVRKWDVYSGLPRSISTHAANTLVYEQVVDEDGNIIKEYSDAQGRVVLSRVSKTGSTETLDTYYVYDEMDRLRFIIPPLAVSNYTPTADYADTWYYEFEYDERGNIIISKSPGVDKVIAIYDNYGRVVLIQDGNQRAKSPAEWSFFKYDELNRPVITGIYKTARLYKYLINDVKNTSLNPYRFEVRNTSSVGYTLNRTFPTTVGESDLLSISYFDDYSYLSNTNWDVEGHSYAAISQPEVAVAVDYAVKGQPTGSKVKVIGGSKWLNTVVYYDSKYRPLQLIAENHLNGTDRMSMAYDFMGRSQKMLLNHVTASVQLKVLEEYEYDHSGRLRTVKHAIDNQDPVILASYKYDGRDQMIEKNLYSTNNGSSYIQSIDYMYNIRGWLTHINDADLTSGENDLFGMELVYNNATVSTINGRSIENQYGGDLAAIFWKRNDEHNSSIKEAYSFEYDNFTRLMRANYANETGGYTGDGGMHDERVLQYDKNGNIKALQRYENVAGATNPTSIDDLTYAHTGNQLQQVEDAGTYRYFGFNEHNVSLPTEYTYDENGNVKEDLNSEIVSIIYNYLDLPERIEFYDGIVITNTYDATGTQLSKVVTKDGQTIRSTDYIGSIQYENAELAFVLHNEGRAINKSDKYEYEYFMTDHVGNTRLTFGMLSEVNVYKATMEEELASQEESDFLNVAATRSGAALNSQVLNTTPSSPIVPFPEYIATTKGNTSRTVGPAIQLAVKQGRSLKYLPMLYSRVTKGGIIH
ncbi:DUF6443 domain-containing protein [Fulvivirga imtechensis]|nr:DUF6443 domain-containing protein [Fulvivirga imtechensis]